VATNVAEKGGLLRAQQRESVWHRNQEETQWKFDWEFWNLKGERTLSSIRRGGNAGSRSHFGVNIKVTGSYLEAFKNKWIPSRLPNAEKYFLSNRCLALLPYWVISIIFLKSGRFSIRKRDKARLSAMTTPLLCPRLSIFQAIECLCFDAGLSTLNIERTLSRQHNLIGCLSRINVRFSGG
jgi:hypothetical protein